MKVVLVRHGEPDYTLVTERGFKGHGRDLAQLTEEGIGQAIRVSRDSRLDGAELIVSSPYTRALQTAAIISRKRDLDISIELDLHEWLPDLTFSYSNDSEVIKAGKELEMHRGVYKENEKKNWEELSTVGNRAINSLKKYMDYNKIIVVCHGIVMRQFKFKKHIDYCGILEIDFHEGYTWGGWVEDK